jgi:hypothetical protein
MAAKDRDEKGKFAKGNKTPTQFNSGGIAAEMGRKGGIAKGEKAAEKRRWKDMLEDLLQLPIEIKLPDGAKKLVTMNDAILFGQIKAATAGKTKAAKFLAQLKGELIEKQEINGNLNVKKEDPDFDNLPDDVKMEIVRKIQDAKHEQYMKNHYGEGYETDTTD